MTTVLIIDDSDFMRTLIKNIVTNQGFTVVGEAESGRTGAIKYIELRPDVVISDYVMDDMDGITGLRQIIGYNPDAVVIMLSSLMGQQVYVDEAKAIGAKEVLAKPIDIRKFNAMLGKYLKDPGPEGSSRHGDDNIREFTQNPKLLEVFCRDAKKAVVTLRETIRNDNMKLYTTTVHAMKSALANIDEHELSDMALLLETAGRGDNKGFVLTNTEGFISALETLVENIWKAISADENMNSIVEDGVKDKVFLVEQLRIIKTACEDYDDEAVYTAYDRLRKMQWDIKTATDIEEIRDNVFLHSDFEKARSIAMILLSQME